jgi:sugar porter (SP) family MFS transporter
MKETTPLIMLANIDNRNDSKSNGGMKQQSTLETRSQEGSESDWSLLNETPHGHAELRELLQLVMVAAATAATLGYDVGIMAAAIQPLESEMNLSGVQKELAMGSLNFVAAAGALWGGSVADKKGRKATIQLCAWIFIVGTLCMALAPNYAVLLLGRIVTGLGVGVSFIAAPVFISEVAPTEHRGQLNTVFDVAINGGILFGYIVGFLVQISTFIPSHYKWRIMLGLGIVLPAIVLCCLATLPESPRWLMMVHQKPAAIEVMRRLGNSEVEINETIKAIENELQQQQRIRQMRHEQHLPLWRLSSGQLFAIKLGFWQQVTGTEAVLYYSADFLASAGLVSPAKRLLGNVFVGVCKLVPELLAMQVVDSIGRKPLIFGSAVALMSTTAALASSFWLNFSPYVVVGLLCSVMASFSAGLGPFTFLVVSENLDTQERAQGMTLGAAANRCTSGTVALTAVSLSSLLGVGGFFAFYAFVGLLSLPFYYSLPETAGSSLEELSAARSRDQGVPPPPPSQTVELMDETMT